MSRLHYSICTVIPPHIQRFIADYCGGRASNEAASTIGQTLALPVASPPAYLLPGFEVGPTSTRLVRLVFDARNDDKLPGNLIFDKRRGIRSADVHAVEAYEAILRFYQFLAIVFLRNSLDGRGMRIEATIHFGYRYANACWNGRQVIFGDGTLDGRLTRFTLPLEVVAHELMHGVIQFTIRLAYSGQSGAICEHIADAFGSMCKQFTLGQTASQADWLIGASLLGPAVKGRAIRSMLHPGTAYDDPALGRDPQPAHMRDYDDSPADAGGIHVNSGILNRAFALAALDLGGYSWQVLGRIWYRVLTGKLLPEASFTSFADATIVTAGELYGVGSRVQHSVRDAWGEVGVPVRPLPFGRKPELPISHRIFNNQHQQPETAEGTES